MNTTTAGLEPGWLVTTPGETEDLIEGRGVAGLHVRVDVGNHPVVWSAKPSESEEPAAPLGDHPISLISILGTLSELITWERVRATVSFEEDFHERQSGFWTG